ncbi:hypothetical protein D9Q98_004266 [Chlorella vulgaris]|uniref:Reverse transcriptase domain-containing protein n=1 Tax=Chlorella vulgaris TaxID=3077 RepID=A0A9D4TRN8_CHLVU|nr:hypothetical protein D9Q98_004266 [Chlorella vulgaris]
MCDERCCHCRPLPRTPGRWRSTSHGSQGRHRPRGAAAVQPAKLASSIRAGGQVSLRRQHDTAHVVLLLCNLQVQACAEGLQLCACFVDFRKAYDSVPRERLWDKLAAIGPSPLR